MNFTKKINSLLFICLIFTYLNGCAQVATGTAVKVATVSQEERTIGEFVDDAIIKAVIKTHILIKAKNCFLI